MRRNLFAIFIASVWTINLVAQSKFDITPYGLDVLRKAEQSFCLGDTLHTIILLESYTENYPEVGNTLLVYSRLGDFYTDSEDYNLAISRLTKSLDIIPKSGPLGLSDSCKLFNGISYGSIKADICVKLSKIYVLVGNNEKALSYLTLADTKYLPYQECGNGIAMYRTNLSLSFADYYLTVGDTTQAINRLLDFFMSGEGYDVEVTAKLKKILITIYSQAEIRKEIETGISEMKVINGDSYAQENILYLTLFGHTIKIYIGSKDLTFYKKIFIKNRNLQTLKEA